MELSHWLGSLLFFLVACNLTHAQTDVSSSSKYSSGALAYGAILGDRDPVVVARPFSGEINARKVVRESDGNEVIYECHGAIARDSQGRVRREQFPSPMVRRPDGRGGQAISGIVISDPIAGVELRWDSMSRAVATFPLLSTPGNKPEPLDACEYEAGKTRSYPNGESQIIEFLGERTIQGISARGCRVTTLIPERTLQNDRTFTVTDESWTSYELHLSLIRIHGDPGLREDETVELDNITLGEPNASLFQLTDSSPPTSNPRIASPNPKLIEGPWETAGVSGIDGIFLTTVTGSNWQTINIRVYHRDAGKETSGNFGTDEKATEQSYNTQDAHSFTLFNGSRLRIHFVDVTDLKPFDLDLTFSSNPQEWSGTWSRPGQASNVVLRRPEPKPVVTVNPFVGDWTTASDKSYLAPGSLHIRQSSDGTLSAWLDRVIASRDRRNGELLLVHSATAPELDLERPGDTGPRNRYHGRLSGDGQMLTGNWADEGSGTLNAPDQFRKVPD